jgi:hypothetical protein
VGRRRGAEEEGISLFPFLSIIACVIGVLTLLISTMSLAQMGTEDVASLEQYERIQRELEKLLAEIEQLRSEMDDETMRKTETIDQRRRALLAAQQQFERLLNQIVEIRRWMAEIAEEANVAGQRASEAKQQGERIRDELSRLERRVAQLNQELEDQQEPLAALEKELDQRQQPPEEAQVSILPSGSAVGFEPVFVECASGTVVIHQGDSPPRIRTADLAQDEQFLRLLSIVAASPRQRIVFLIREDGLSTYHTASRLADVHEVDHGRLPVVGQGRIDLSYFTNGGRS